MRLPVPTVFSSLWFLAACALIGNVEYALILPSAWRYLQRLGAHDPVWLGAAIGAVPLAALLTSPLYSRYLDRHSLAWALVASLVVSFGGYVASANAAQTQQLFSQNLALRILNMVLVTLLCLFDFVALYFMDLHNNRFTC